MMERMQKSLNRTPLQYPVLQKLRHWRQNLGLPLWGELSLASLFVAILSGVLLAIHYDPGPGAFSSVVKINETIPFGFFIRGVHYYSAEIFVIATIVHTLDHFWRRSFIRYPLGMWMMISLLLPLAFWADFTGFILPGNLEGRFAGEIMHHLAGSIPVIGQTFANILIQVDQPGHFFRLPYLHHVVTITLALIFLTQVHIQRLTPFRSALLWTLILCIVPATLHTVSVGIPPNGVADPVKGPWYFLGLQELLSHAAPFWAGVVAPAALLALFLSLPALPFKWVKSVEVVLWLGLAVYVVLTCIAAFFRGPGWAWTF